MQLVFIKILIAIFCIISNIVVCIAIQRDQVLRRSPTFQILFLIFISNMIDIGARLLYDYPSELIGKPIAGQPYTIIKHVLCNGGWFSQLFLLQCVAISHLGGVFFSVEYRNFKMKNVIIICGCIIGTAFITGGFVLLLPNMGFVFNEKSFTWYEDLRYPGMVVHIWYNWIVQAFTLLILTITDIAILWKVITLRLSQTLEQNPRTLSRSDTSKESSIKKRVKVRYVTTNEIRIALNFFLLSGCLFLQTIIYNTVPGWDSPVATFLLTVTPLMRGSKCWFYCISGKTLRSAILKVLMCT